MYIDLRGTEADPGRIDSEYLADLQSCKEILQMAVDAFDWDAWEIWDWTESLGKQGAD